MAFNQAFTLKKVLTAQLILNKYRLSKLLIQYFTQNGTESFHPFSQASGVLPFYGAFLSACFIQEFQDHSCGLLTPVVPRVSGERVNSHLWHLVTSLPLCPFVAGRIGSKGKCAFWSTGGGRWPLTLSTFSLR